MEYMILVTIDTYNMVIDNLDIKLVILWDFPITFNIMI